MAWLKATCVLGPSLSFNSCVTFIGSLSSLGLSSLNQHNEAFSLDNLCDHLQPWYSLFLGI